MKKNKVSPDEVLSFIGFGPFQVLAFLLSSFTNLAYSCDMSIFIFVQQSIMKEWNITITQFAFLPAATGVPNIVGALIFSTLSDHYGRLWPYALCVAWVAVFSLASAFSNSFYMLIGLRCGASVGIGGVAGFVNPSVIEFLPVRNRGKVTVLNTLVGTLGVCLSCGLAWWLIPAYPKHGWRYYIIASAVPMSVATLFRVAFYFESPRFLIAKKKYDKAWKIFEKMAAMNGKKLSEFTRLRDYSIQSELLPTHERDKRKTYCSQFLNMFHPRYLRTTVPLSVISITQTAGYLISQLYLPSFLNMVGGSVYFVIMVSTVSQIPGIALLSIIIEWPEIGRLNSFRIFSALCGILFILLAFCQTSISIPVLLVLIFFCSAPLYGLVFTYIAEVYATSIRSVATAYFYVFQALTYLIGALLASRAVAVQQHWVFPVVFAGCFFVQLAMSLLMNHEPLGMKLRDTA